MNDGLADLTAAPRKAYRFLTAADGAQLHDAPIAPPRRNQIVFDWLGRILEV